MGPRPVRPLAEGPPLAPEPVVVPLLHALSTRARAPSIAMGGSFLGCFILVLSSSRRYAQPVAARSSDVRHFREVKLENASACTNLLCNRYRQCRSRKASAGTRLRTGWAAATRSPPD